VTAARRPSLATVVLQFIFDNSLLLLAGAATALVWANVDVDHYERATHVLHFAVNDIGMVFFFALATKEVYEATLPGGPLASPRQAAVPVLAAIGGMAAPAAIYVASVVLMGRHDLVRGWAIPCATDIAFSYLVARMVFPRGHAAIPFLLLLAIADDALGLLVLALFYPSGPVALGQLVLWLGPALLVAWLFRKSGIGSFWMYVLGPGLLAWIGLFVGGIHPALALVPIVPFMPHEKSDLKLFRNRPPVQVTTLHEFEQWWRIPVQIILLAFGLVNAGVPLASVGPVTWIIAASLIVGKPLGIVATTALAERIGFRRAADLHYRGLVVMGVAAGIGFTVALFFTTAAFPRGVVLDEAKMGALVSFLAAPLAVGVGWLLRIKRTRA
jgi:Na+:H+ antiporter, NhaA family